MHGTVIPDALEHARAVRAARRVVECRKAIRDLPPAVVSAAPILGRAAREYERIVRAYADAALAGTWYKGL